MEEEYGGRSKAEQSWKESRKHEAMAKLDVRRQIGMDQRMMCKLDEFLATEKSS